MTDWKGLWSYVHADDEAEGGRISRLAKDVASQFEMQTGEKIELFLDTDAVKWGENWREEIDEGLSSIAFFIPVLTPRYFMSHECRRELRFFADRATSLGVKELVLPLLYVDVESLHDDTVSDDLVALVMTFQWENWLELRFAELTSGGYRRGVSRLAARLVEANRQADQTDIVANVRKLEGSPEDETDETPGLLDRLADMEAAFPEWQLTLESIGQDIALVGEITWERPLRTLKGATHRVRDLRRASPSLVRYLRSCVSPRRGFGPPAMTLRRSCIASMRGCA